MIITYYPCSSNIVNFSQNLIRTKHEAGERSEPAECVVSYCAFQDFPATFSEYIDQQNCPVAATLGAGEQEQLSNFFSCSKCSQILPK